MGPFQMSSRKPVSTARPQTFWSMEYGEDLVTSIGSACSAANAIALSRVMPESRTGASTRRSGASAPKPTSKRTWSLPLPVQPWASALAPYRRAASTMCLTITGRDSAETSGYRSMYSALARSAGRQWSSANSSLRSSTSASTAPQASALYMDRYPLVSALSRPVIVKHMVEAARRYGASVLAHGCTGKGNDQVRFEVGFGALAPDLRVLAPVRDSGMTRDKAIAFAAEQALPIDVTKSSPYSIDQNVWGRAVETGFLEDIWNGPIEDVYSYTHLRAHETPEHLVC